MHTSAETAVPVVPTWQLMLLRLSYLLIAGVMGSAVWHQLLFESANVPVSRGLARSMLAALALLSLLGLRYPVRMLPLMIYELVWKTVWILAIAAPAWFGGRMTRDIEALFYECIGVLFVYVVIPWPYVFARYFREPAEPWTARR